MGKASKRNETRSKGLKKKAKQMHYSRDAMVCCSKSIVDKRGSKIDIAGKAGCKTSGLYVVDGKEIYVDQSDSRQFVKGVSNGDTAQLRFEGGSNVLVKEKNTSKLIRGEGSHGITASIKVEGTKDFRSEMEDSHVVVDGRSAGSGSLVCNIICSKDGSTTQVHERNVFTEIRG